MPRTASLILGLAIMVLAAWAVWAASAWPLKAKLFPLAIGIPLFLLAMAEVLWTLLRPGDDTTAAQTAEPPWPRERARTLAAGAWMVGFFVAILLLGFEAAVPLFVFLYLRLQGRESWTMCVVFTAVTWAVFYGLFDLLLRLPFPAGWIQGWLGFA